jgi:hypothetical protein
MAALGSCSVRGEIQSVDSKELRRKLMILYGMNLNKRNKIPEIPPLIIKAFKTFIF